MTPREQQILQLIEQNPMISQQELAEALQITRSSVGVHISNLVKKGCIAGKGYVLRRAASAVVIGGINVDIGGRSLQALVPGDSNPGRVRVSLGGVGRNIAHNLTLLGTQVHMLGAMGDDLYSRQVEASCRELGMDVSQVLRVPGAATSTYLYIADENGEMALAMSDMGVCDAITPAYLSAHLPLLQSARAVVIDTNLPRESLIWLAENVRPPIFCDPVSTLKAPKLLPILHRIHTLKPNRMEAELLSGIPVRSRKDAERAAEILLQKGVGRVFLSMGNQGIYAAQAGKAFWIPAIPGNTVSTTGCGDAAAAALVWAYLEGADLRQSALACAAAGSIAMESPETINPALSATALRARIEKSTV